MDYAELNVTPLSKDDFNRLNSVKLFCSILGRDVVVSEWDTFQSLIYQLEGHPLAIVLAATQAQREISLNHLLTRWDKAKQDTVGMHEKHSSMEIALKVSWDAISTNSVAIIQWGLHYYSLKAIPVTVFQTLRGDTNDEDWQEGLSILIGASLVYVTQNREAIAMLLPLKKQFERLTAANRQIQEDCLIRWAQYIENLLDSANKRLSIDRLVWHQQTVEFAPQIFYIMEQLMIYGTDSTHQHLNYIVLKVGYYYQFYIQSVTLLERLTSYYREHDSSYIVAIVLQEYGDLLRRLGDVEGAKESYDSVEGLYRKERDNLGLANLLQSRGDLYKMYGQPEQAYAHYKEAVKLYRENQDPMGLIYTLAEQYECCMVLNLLSEAEAIRKETCVMVELDNISSDVKEYVLQKLQKEY